MSLTSFVAEPTIRDRFTDEFPNQGDRATEPLKAEWQTQNYMLIGTAFDYLLRFWLRQNVPECHARSWVAETSLELTEERFPEYKSDVQAAITRAKEARDEYLENGVVTRPLIESAIDLARIDGIYRGGEPPANLGEYEDGDIVDCIRLIEILDSSDALDGERVHLNPAFGLGSTFVGGADADAILNGTLIDVKTTSKSTFKIDYWRQLVGYLVLADIHNTLHEMGIYDQFGFANNPDYRQLPEIDSFGVYFARHGELSTESSNLVYESDGYSDFRSWFVETALDTHEPFDDTLDEIIRGLF